MPKPLPAVLLFAILAAPLAAQSPSPQPGFDCSKAATPQEKAICASPELSKADAEMTAAYKAWLAAAPAGSQEAIRQSQRLWLRTRTVSCKPGDADTPLAKCLLSSDQSRTKDLAGMIEHRSGTLFVWQPLTLTAPDSAEVAQMMHEDGRPDFGTVTVSWPQAKSTTPEWVAWNKAIAAIAQTDYSGEKPKPAYTRESAVDQDVDVAVTFNSVTDNLVSTAIQSYFYGHGAAHPNHGISQFNWLLKEKRELKPADLFLPQSNWSTELYKRTNQYLHKKLDSDGESYESFAQPGEMKKTVQALVIDPHRWQIDKEGITIDFEPYEVACYACTPPSFTISWDSLKPLLNPAFQIPR